MKRIILTAALLAAAMTAGAQTIYDALTYAQNDYIGTARSLALGNAMTALGGDLGSLTLNPAGSAVSPYSQFEFTLGRVSVSSMSDFSVNGRSSLNGSDGSKASMPNIGLNIVMDTYRTSGLKSYSIGLVTNTTAFHFDRLYGAGENNTSSFTGAMASNAYPYSPDALGGNSYNNSNIPWNYITGYQSYLISDIEKRADGAEYVGAAELYDKDADGYITRYVPGTLFQESSRNTSGRKRDILMNFGMNFNDNFYLGFSLGMPVSMYSYDEYMLEQPQDPQKFTYKVDDKNVSLTKASYLYSYNADVTGLYAKIGVIWKPTRHLRLGAAIQTPTVFGISETWQVKGETKYTDSKFDAWANSPQSEYSYTLTTPARLNLGVAYTFGSKAFVSVDYETADYSTMWYSSDSGYESDFASVNRVNQLFGAKQNMLRIGAEYKLSSKYSARLGYSMTTSPEYYYHDNEGFYVDAPEYLLFYKEYNNGKYTLEDRHLTNGGTDAYSVGFGYSSPGSFYCDLAYRILKRPSMNYMPYDNYVLDVDSPLVSVSDRYLKTFLVTFGWRF